MFSRIKIDGWHVLFAIFHLTLCCQSLSSLVKVFTVVTINLEDKVMANYMYISTQQIYRVVLCLCYLYHQCFLTLAPMYFFTVLPNPVLICMFAQN